MSEWLPGDFVARYRLTTSAHQSPSRLAIPTKPSLAFLAHPARNTPSMILSCRFVIGLEECVVRIVTGLVGIRDEHAALVRQANGLIDFVADGKDHGIAGNS